MDIFNDDDNTTSLQLPLTTLINGTITIELIATKRIYVGDVLKIENLPPFGFGGSGSDSSSSSSNTHKDYDKTRKRNKEQDLLLKQLHLTGQTYYQKDLFKENPTTAAATQNKKTNSNDEEEL